MFRILVVDDEPRQRRILSRVIRSHDSAFEVLEARNGQEALSFHQKQPFDIMFVDIQMPVMDGLELIENIRKTDDGKTQISIISGYGEFAFAQKAIGLQVAEYLLKPIEEELVIQVLERMQGKILQRRAREDWKDDAREIYAINLLRRYFLAPSSKETKDRVRSILPNTSYALVLCVEWEGSHDEVSRHNDRLDGLANVVLFHEPHGKRAIAVVGVTDRAEGSKILDYLQNKCAFERDVGNMLWIGAGSIQKQKSVPMQRAYQHARIALSMRFYEPEKTLFVYDQIAENYSRKLSVYPQLDDAIFGNIDGDVEGRFLAVKDWMLGLTNGRWVAPDVLLLAIGGVLQQQQHSIMERMLVESRTSLPDIENLYESSSLDDACRWLCQYLSQKEAAVEHALSKRHHAILERCLDRMESEFHPELSLSTVADWCHFSPSYFSKLFKEYTGKSFIDYMVALRLSKAAGQLKNSHRKVYEIAEEVGYRDVKYFTRVFKKAYGVSPNEFRTLATRPSHTSD